jgi:threonine/homoserine/homoserine lactone efflux protein
MHVLFFSAFGMALALACAPGVVMAEALRRGVSGGFRAALMLTLGSLVGDALWAIVALAGAALVMQHTTARLVLGALGTGLLFWFAWDGLRQSAGTLTASPKAGGHFAVGAFISLANPHAVAFWLGIGGSLIALGMAEPKAGDFAVFFAGFMSAMVCWCFGFSALVAWGRHYITPALLRALNLLCALGLGWFGVCLLVETARLLFGG